MFVYNPPTPSQIHIYDGGVQSSFTNMGQISVLCQYVNMIVVETNFCCHHYTSGTSLATDGGAVNREATEINAISARVWALNNTPG